MKKLIVMLAMVFTAVCSSQTVFAETFPVINPLKMTVKIEPIEEGQQYVIIIDGKEEEELYLEQYFQDILRPMNKRNQHINPRVSNAYHKEFVLQTKGVRYGQVAFNFRTKNGHLWMGLPTCMITLGDGLSWGDSRYSPNIPESGGAMIVMTASGIKVQYPLDNLGCYETSVVTVISTAPSKKSTKKSHVHKGKDGKSFSCEKDPCELLNSIKEDTTVIRADVKEIKTDVKEIKVDVKEIKTDVKDVKSSVGMPDPNEPADEKTLQQKARKTLDSVGVADKTDEADEKTLHQKVRKGLKIKKEIHKSVGKPKDGKTSLHQKHDITHDKIDKLQSDVDIIKAEVLKTGGHTLPAAGTSKDQPSCSTVGCHVSKDKAKSFFERK